jgi:hypothetical protein
LIQACWVELDSIKTSFPELPQKRHRSAEKTLIALLNEFKTEMAKQISELKKECESKIKGMEVVNESLTKEVISHKESNAKLKTQGQTTCAGGSYSI